jgi:hypothetical protein
MLVLVLVLVLYIKLRINLKGFLNQIKEKAKLFDAFTLVESIENRS